MKKIFSILAIAAAMVACSKDDATTDTATDVAPATYTLTGYSSLDTRTEFDTPIANKIPFLWSQGDKILVLNDGGTATEGEISAGAGTSSATFSLTTASENGNTVYYNLNVKKGGFGIITADAAATAKVPAEQRTTNNLGQNGDFGYAEVADGAFRLNHATAYLWFDVTLPAGYTLQSISFNAGEAKVAGEAKWDGSAFGEVNGSSVIDLVVDNNATMVAMVVLPATIESATITYRLSNGTNIKCYEQTLGRKDIVSGKTYKISVDLAEPETEYELRVLTFEGEYWTDLIDPKQQGGNILYAGDWSWYDSDNTGLCHIALNGGAYTYAGGGHAISNYTEPEYHPDYLSVYLNKYYDESELTGYEGWQFLQLMTPCGAHSGNNFAVHYGYIDYTSSFTMCSTLTSIDFKDENGNYLEPRIIDHMYVTNTNYALNQIIYGVSREDDGGSGDQFGGDYDGINPDTYLKIVAYGYEDYSSYDEESDDFNNNPADDENVKKAEFYLVKDGAAVVDWTKWDLSELGPVVKVKFNFEFSGDMGGDYGFTIPAYFAYDDVAVRFYNDEK